MSLSRRSSLDLSASHNYGILHQQLERRHQSHRYEDTPYGCFAEQIMVKKLSLRKLLKTSQDESDDRHDDDPSKIADGATDPMEQPQSETADDKKSEKADEERIQLLRPRRKKKMGKANSDQSANNDDKEEKERKLLFGSNGKKKAAKSNSETDCKELNLREGGIDKDIKDGADDVHKMLEDMEIPEFNLSISFDDENEVHATETSNEDEQVDYENRLEREEVFSKRYHPSKVEKKELEHLAEHLGVTSSSMRLTTCQTNVHELIFGDHSIILKRGPVSFNDQNCDLILLTDGFISVYRKFNAFNPLESRYETSQLWSTVEFVEVAGFGILKMKMKSGESFEICSCSEGEDLAHWLNAIEQVIILSTIHTSISSTTKTDRLGWQYTLVRKPAYTAAVLGEMKLMGSPRDLNQLDEYNQCSPLHYSVQQEPCNADIVDALLRAGADPNLTDGDGHSAMYYAQRNQLSDIEEILMEHGGKKSKLVEIELRGELFGGIDQAERNTGRRREIEQAVKDNQAAEATRKAQSVQSQMSQNMAAMIERGEKINTMDDKARKLNDEAKQYGSLASQLKDKMKSKKWYQF